MRGKSLPSLTSLRFFAAFLVAIHHLYHVPVAGVETQTPVGIGAAGFVGVTFFFILSGFVLTWTWKAHEPKHLFYLRRVARVYPLAVLVALAAIVFYALRVDPSTFTGFGGLFPAKAIASVLLLQTWVPKGEFHQAFNSPAWSLSNEVFFYLLMPFLIPLLSRLKARTVGIISMAWLLLGSIAGQITSPALLYSFPPYRIAEFTLGMALAGAVREGAKIRLPLWAGALIAVGSFALLYPLDALTHGLIMWNRPFAGALMALPFAALIWSAVGHDLAGKTGILHAKPLIKLGQWSFALYLIHDLFYRSIARVAMPAVPAERFTYGLVGLAVAQTVAALLYEWYERPVERAIRRRLHQGDSQMAAMDRTVEAEAHSVSSS